MRRYLIFLVMSGVLLALTFVFEAALGVVYFVVPAMYLAGAVMLFSQRNDLSFHKAFFILMGGWLFLALLLAASLTISGGDGIGLSEYIESLPFLAVALLILFLAKMVGGGKRFLASYVLLLFFSIVVYYFIDGGCQDFSCGRAVYGFWPGMRAILQGPINLNFPS